MMSCNFKNLVERLYLTELISLKSHIGGFYSFELGKESAVIKNKGLGGPCFGVPGHYRTLIPLG